MNKALTFISQTRGVQLSPFKPATELPVGTLEGRLMRLPLYCGKHEAFYPAELAQETLRTGRHYIFLSGCECPLGYIIRTEVDGAHTKRWGEPEAIEAAYEDWPGEEFVIEDEHGTCFFQGGIAGPFVGGVQSCIDIRSHGSMLPGHYLVSPRRSVNYGRLSVTSLPDEDQVLIAAWASLLPAATRCPG